MDSLGEAVSKLCDASLFLTDRSYRTVNDIRTACNEFSKTLPLGLVIIDAMPLISSIEASLDVWEVAKALKLTARELDIPVLVTSHLYTSRTERRPDKRPRMGDLAGIESYADEVILLHRKESMDEFSDEREIVELIVAKQTNGPPGYIELAFQPRFARFETVDNEQQD